MDEKVPPKKARQGRSGTPVLLVLIGGLVLAGLVWVVAEVYGVFIDERQPVEMPQSSEDVPLDQAED